MIYYNADADIRLNLNSSDKVAWKLSDENVPYHQLMLYLPLSLIPLCIIGVIGNIILILLISRQKKLHTPSYILSANMALSDIIFLCFVSSHIFMTIVFNNAENIPRKMYKVICKLDYSAFATCIITSSQSLMAISIDRYFTVHRKSHKRSPFNNKKVLIITILLTWTIGLVLASSFKTAVHVNFRYPYLCDLQRMELTLQKIVVHRLIACLFAYPFPVLIMTLLYYKICRKIRKVSINCHLRAANKNRDNRCRQIYATKLMILTTILHMINALPFFLVWIMLIVTRLPYIHLLLTNRSYVLFILTFGFGMLTLNSVQNPIIFCTYNNSIRRGIRLLLRKKKFKRVAPLVKQ